MPLREAFLCQSVVLLALVSLAPVSALADDRQPVDRILAVVDDDPILSSEVDQVLALGVVQPEEGEGEREARRRALDFLIEERLRFHEVDRFGLAEVPVDVVDAEFERLQAEFGGPAKFGRVLDESELSEQGARQLLARQVMIWVYVEERLGARVFVGIEDIRQYYEEELLPELAARGEGKPEFDEVREAIRNLLRERRMNEELERWTTELLQAADVEDFFDSQFEDLPPAVMTIGGESGGAAVEP